MVPFLRPGIAGAMEDCIMMRVGAHVSIGGGVHNAPANATAIGAKAFAIFVQNPRQWGASALSSAEIAEFQKAMDKEGFKPQNVVPHSNYLVNLGDANDANRPKSFTSFLSQMRRCEELGLRMLNVHPGAHPGDTDAATCLGRIADCINQALDKTHGVAVVLEITAGQGASVGHTFEELAAIIDKVEDKKRVGVCFDTCHAFAAGYDIRSREGYRRTMAELDAVIGRKYLKALHLNDSKKDLSSRLDRHDNLGKGLLGIDTFKFLMNDPALDEIPMILETYDDSLWKKEIAMLYGFVKK